MRSKEAARTARTPSSAVPLAAQSRDDPEPYSLPAMTSSGTLLGGVPLRRVEDGHLLAAGQVAGVAALGAGGELVAQPDVGEGAADHHLVVAAPGPVGVEVPRLHPVPGQVAACGGVRPDRAGRGDVVGGDRVAEQGEHPGALDVGAAAPGSAVQPVEVGRPAHVGGGRAPRRTCRRPGPAATATARHRRTPAAYSRVYISGRRQEAMTSPISAWDGQMSRRYTGCPSLPVPSGSVVRSVSIVPARA